jgi:A/G-specific adenine glycosylase
LHRLARVVVHEHDGTVPADAADLEALPGVGRYTAGAVSTFAYERRAAVVDTNVARVLTRVFALDRAARRNGTEKPSERTLWDLAERLLPQRRRVVWEFNQALMDLGARICTARSPRCPDCPVRPACRTGRPTPKRRRAAA